MATNSCSFCVEDVQVVADLFTSFTEGDCEQLLSRVLFDEFGRLLEAKFTEFQAKKEQVKDAIRRNMGEKMVPKTPRRQKPAAVLLDRIHRFKVMTFLSEDQSPTDGPHGSRSAATGVLLRDNVGESRVCASARMPLLATATGGQRTNTRQAKKAPWQVEKQGVSTPMSIMAKALPISATVSSILSSHPIAMQAEGNFAEEQAVDPYAMEGISTGSAENLANGGASTQRPATEKRKKKMPFTPSQTSSVFAPRKAVCSTVRSTIKQPLKSRLRNSSMQRKKSAQMKKFEEKAQQADRQKREILKDKAERAKRDREERKLRVEQNNRLKEAELKEREQQIRAQEERLREFRLEQQQCLKSPATATKVLHSLPQVFTQLPRVPSSLSSSSTSKSQAPMPKTPILSKQQQQPVQQGTVRAAAPPLVPAKQPPFFRSGLGKKGEVAEAANSRKEATNAKGLVEQATSLPATPPLATAQTAKGENVVVSAEGSTTPFPHKVAGGNEAHERANVGLPQGCVNKAGVNRKSAASNRSTPTVLTPRQVAVPAKRKPRDTEELSSAAALAAASKKQERPAPAAGAQPKTRAALAFEKARMEREEAESKTKLLEKAKEEKAMYVRQQALRDFKQLKTKEENKQQEEEKKAKEEEKAKVEKARLEAEEHADKDQPFRKGQNIQEVVEASKQEIAAKQEAMLTSGTKLVMSSPFLPPARAKKEIAYVSIDESMEEDSGVDEVVTLAARVKVVAGEAVEEKLNDGSISEDLTPSPASIEGVAKNLSKPTTMQLKDKYKNKENEETPGAVRPSPIATPQAGSNKKVVAVKQLLETSVYNMTPDKVFLPSTKDNYNVDDLSSGDDTDNEDQPRKKVPQWAEKADLFAAQKLRRRHLTDRQVEHHFGKIKAPQLSKIFPNLQREEDRSMSAIWSSPLHSPTPGFSGYQRFRKELGILR